MHAAVSGLFVRRGGPSLSFLRKGADVGVGVIRDFSMVYGGMRDVPPFAVERRQGRVCCTYSKQYLIRYDK